MKDQPNKLVTSVSALNVSRALYGDERGGWTSASAAERDRLCPGAHLACLGLPEESSEEAQAGREIHAHLHWKRQLEFCLDRHRRLRIEHDDSGHSQEPVCDYELADRCWQMEQKAVSDWLARLPAEAEQYELEVFSEKRLWLQFCKVDGLSLELKHQHSGQPDAVYRKGRWALVLDSKSGWLEVSPPNTNEQLRDLAVLLYHNSPLELVEVQVAIVQPGAEPQPPCVYDREALKMALALLEKRVIASNDPLAKRVPSPDTCRFCRAKGTSRCPETQQAVVTLPSLPVAEVPSARLVEAALMARSVSTAILEAAKAALKANPDAIPGFKLEPNPPNKPITSPTTCWERCAGEGMTLEQFMGCVLVGKGDLEDALKEVIRKKTGQKRVAGWSNLWTRLLDGITTEEPKEPSIVRVSKQ